MHRETCADVFNPKWFWERISKGGVTVFSIAPEGYDRLAEYFDEHITKLPQANKEIYVHEICTVKFAGATGSLLLPQTQKKWTELRRGKPLLNLYGSTEVTLICGMRWENPDYPDMVNIQHPKVLRGHIKCALVLNRTSGARSGGEARGWRDAPQSSYHVFTVQ
jgi:acyl-coenzyme A synthetase/AMP-(fatty) acid ligase